MMRLLPAVLCLPLVACVVGDAGTGPTGDDDDQTQDPGGNNGEHPDPPLDPPAGDPARISTDTTWSGTVAVDVITTIDAGVTLTVSPGTTINMKSGTQIKVEGIMDVQGTSAEKVTIAATVPTQPHAGISVLSGGQLTLSYVVQSGGGIHTTSGATATIRDSTFSNPGGPSSRGDFLVMGGGTLDMQYSEIGLSAGDGTHCNLHFGGQNNTITIMNSTIRGVPYGLMLYGGQNANLSNNNWDNPIDIDTQPGVSANIEGSYFKRGAPTAQGGAQFTGIPSETERTDALPRP
ncbi:MAG: right-handed parallel beta-helix repeat-containing protein [Kofleriaceae bacterium]